MNRINQLMARVVQRCAIAAWCAVAAAVCGGPLVDRPVHAADPVLGPTASPQQLLADQYVLLTRAALQSRGEPVPAQFARAAILLDQAAALQPNDAEIWRLRLELARRMGDAAAELRSLEQIARLAPQDDVVQYQLILQRLIPMQTVEQRIAVVERMLNAAGAEQLSPALRSKLATYAAVGAREVGDGPRTGARVGTPRGP